MDADERRNRISRMIASSQSPVTGGELAAKTGVTRQIVVQDVAILRAGGFPIIATPSGYIMIDSPAVRMPSKVFACRHNTPEEAREELLIIVENGGTVRDVIVEHPVYGEITGTLMLRTRDAVEKLMERLARPDSQMLSSMTGGVHMHTVEAQSEKELSGIEKELRNAGLLI